MQVRCSVCNTYHMRGGRTIAPVRELIRRVSIRYVCSCRIIYHPLSPCRDNALFEGIRHMHMHLHLCSRVLPCVQRPPPCYTHTDTKLNRIAIPPPSGGKTPLVCTFIRFCRPCNCPPSYAALCCTCSSPVSWEISYHCLSVCLSIYSVLRKVYPQDIEHPLYTPQAPTRIRGEHQLDTPTAPPPRPKLWSFVAPFFSPPRAPPVGILHTTDDRAGHVSDSYGAEATATSDAAGEPVTVRVTAWSASADDPEVSAERSRAEPSGAEQSRCLFRPLPYCGASLSGGGGGVATCGCRKLVRGRGVGTQEPLAIVFRVTLHAVAASVRAHAAEKICFWTEQRHFLGFSVVR